MSVAERVALHLPYLRRFARGVTGSQQSGDAYVAYTLEALLADPDALSPELPPRVTLYQTFLKILNSITLNNHCSGDAETLPPGFVAAKRNLGALAPTTRQAFLLMSVEEFSVRETACILDVDEYTVQRLIDEAGREIASQIVADIVIIEDEPLIALDLEHLVSQLGHRVVEIARTEAQAIEAVKRARPGLILADIRLADGGSGLNAVNEILRCLSVPVIFITAFPQMLLTGKRPEPTFLIAKPFHHEKVTAVISQALFFSSRNAYSSTPEGRTEGLRGAQT